MDARQLLIAIANDATHNIGSGEFFWYGLWNQVLRPFEQIPFCFVFPQFPCWLLRTEGDLSPTSSPLQLPSSDGPFAQHSSQFGITDSFRWQLSQSNVDMASPLSSPSLPPSSPLAYKSAPLSSFPSPPFRDRRVRPPPNHVRERRHKVTDFAVVQIRGNPKSIHTYVVPIILEVKAYHATPIPNKSDRNGYLLEAQPQAERQAAYLFSTRNQPAVIALVASGPYWRWTQIFKRDVNALHGDPHDPDYLPSDDVIVRPQWSATYLIGTRESSRMLDRILRWAGEVFGKPYPPAVIPNLQP